MAATHSALAGHFNGTWDSTALGKTEEGWFLEISVEGEPVTFEEFADNELDMISRGAKVSLEGTLKEASDSLLIDLLWPFHATGGLTNCVGEFAVTGSYAKTIVLTAATCASATPATITLHSCILEPGFISRINLNNRPRLIPVRFKVFLVDVSENSTPEYRHFTFA